MRARRRPRRRRGARVRPRVHGVRLATLARSGSALACVLGRVHPLQRAAPVGEPRRRRAGRRARLLRARAVSGRVGVARRLAADATRPARTTRPASLRRPLRRPPRRSCLRRRAPRRRRARTATCDRGAPARRALDQGPERDAVGSRAAPPERLGHRHRAVRAHHRPHRRRARDAPRRSHPAPAPRKGTPTESAPPSRREGSAAGREQP